MSTLAPRHLLLALLVVFIWGTNFAVMRFGVEQTPPLLFAALRFTFSLLPAIVFVRRPPVPWSRLAAYGLLTGVGLFGLLFIALRSDISPGLASVVIQAQAFFTIALAALLARERIEARTLAGMTLAMTGLILIGVAGNAAASALGIALTLAAALSWAGANLVLKFAGRIDMLGFVVWSCLFAAPPLIGLTLLIDGPVRIVAALQAGGVLLWVAVAWQSAANMLFGYAAWGWLLARYPASAVVPLALLIPVFGLGASAIMLGEPLPVWKLLATGLVMGGLAINAWPRRVVPRQPVPLARPR